MQGTTTRPSCNTRDGLPNNDSKPSTNILRAWMEISRPAELLGQSLWTTISCCYLIGMHADNIARCRVQRMHDTYVLYRDEETASLARSLCKERPWWLSHACAGLVSSCQLASGFTQIRSRHLSIIICNEYASIWDLMNHEPKGIHLPHGAASNWYLKCPQTLMRAWLMALSCLCERFICGRDDS